MIRLGYFSSLESSNRGLTIKVVSNWDLLKTNFERAIQSPLVLWIVPYGQSNTWSSIKIICFHQRKRDHALIGDDLVDPVSHPSSSNYKIHVIQRLNTRADQYTTLWMEGQSSCTFWQKYMFRF